jgi:hypothetical protein
MVIIVIAVRIITTRKTKNALKRKRYVSKGLTTISLKQQIKNRFITTSNPLNSITVIEIKTSLRLPNRIFQIYN